MFYFGNQGPIIEKDLNIQQLKQNVADRLWNIVKEEEIFAQKGEIKFISFEDALKELIKTKNL
jgi:hypothetical protein